MKKIDAIKLPIVPPTEYAPLISAKDPEQSNRIPLNVELTADPNIRSIPARGSIAQAWQGIAFFAGEETYFVSPRVLRGCAWQGGVFKKVVECKLPDKSVQDMLASNLRVKVTSYVPVMVDDFGKETQRSRQMPLFEAIQ